jgi:hypothetical protein
MKHTNGFSSASNGDETASNKHSSGTSASANMVVPSASIGSSEISSSIVLGPTLLSRHDQYCPLGERSKELATSCLTRRYVKTIF